jgi:small-conductance mechanosensitive channel
MLELRSLYHNVLFGWKRERSSRFLGLAGGLCLVTLAVSFLGNYLLQSWSAQYAHIAIELAAFSIFVIVVGAAIVNGYLYGGLVISIALPMALVLGFTGFLVAAAVMTGMSLPSLSMMQSLGTISLWMGLIGVSAHIFGGTLRLLVTK